MTYIQLNPEAVAGGAIGKTYRIRYRGKTYQFTENELHLVSPELLNMFLSTQGRTRTGRVVPLFIQCTVPRSARQKTGQYLAPELSEVRRAFWPEPVMNEELRGIESAIVPPTDFYDLGHSSRPLTITWVLTSPVPLTGGLRVAARLSYYLAKRGHDVHLLFHSSVQQAREALDGLPFKVCGSPGEVPASDYVIATYWATVSFAERVKASKRLILVQGDEPAWPHFTPAQQKTVRAAFTSPGWQCVTIAPHLARKFESYGADVIATLPGNGVDILDFSPLVDQFAPRRAVCFVYRKDPGKRCDVVLEAIAALKRKIPYLFVQAAGFTPFSHPLVDLYVENATTRQMAQMYSFSDCYLNASEFEGSACTPLEAMACGCPPVTTAIGTEEYAVDGYNCLIVRSDPGEVAATAEKIITNQAFRLKLIQNGLVTAKQRPWTITAAALEKILLEHYHG